MYQNKSDSDSDLEQSNVYDLRSKKITRSETDPDRRCKIVQGLGDWGKHYALSQATGPQMDKFTPHTDTSMLRSDFQQEQAEASDSTHQSHDTQEHDGLLRTQDPVGQEIWEEEFLCGDEIEASRNFETSRPEATDRFEQIVTTNRKQLVPPTDSTVAIQGATPSYLLHTGSHIHGQTQSTPATTQGGQLFRPQFGLSGAPTSEIHSSALSKQFQLNRQQQYSRVNKADAVSDENQELRIGQPHVAPVRSQIDEPQVRYLPVVPSRQLTRPAQYTTVSDMVIAPKPFTGKEEEAEDWVLYFQRYCDYRKIEGKEKQLLFAILLREGAADWLLTLKPDECNTFEALLKAFKSNYFKSEQLRWREAADIWNSPQGPEEKVGDYVTRLRKNARHLNLDDDMLNSAVIHGLRSHIRMHILQKGVTNLKDTIQAAKIAEASLSSDPVTALLVETIKATTNAANKHEAQLQKLTSTINAMSVAPIVQPHTSRDHTASNSNVSASREQVGNYNMQSARPTRDWRSNSGLDRRGRGGMRQYRPTPQNQQRENYVRRQGGDVRQNQPPVPQDRLPFRGERVCGNCGMEHRDGECRARGQECYHCGMRGHFARSCRAARQRRQ